jgi:hypothetical protein
MRLIVIDQLEFHDVEISNPLDEFHIKHFALFQFLLFEINLIHHNRFF